MQRLSVVSLAALLAIGGVLAFVTLIHPISAAPSQNAPTGSSLGANTSTASNSTLLSQPPTSLTGGDDGGGDDG